jgi:GNAT superfamily N-acetyltransferase
MTGIGTKAADEWWAKDFGCSPDELRPARTRVQAHTARLRGTPGIWMLVAGGAPIVSMPADVFASLGERAASWTAATLSDEAYLLRELSGLAPGRVGKVIGPAPISYGSRESLDLRDAARAIAVPSESASVAALEAACGDDWHDGGSEAKGEPLFGCADETGQLAALASYKVWESAIAHIYIITHPHRRGRGFARAAVARAAEHALAAGLLPQYRTLRANAPAIAVAKRLGFTEYGFSVYVRMREA